MFYQVVLSENETTEYGEKIAESLMEKLGITKSDLLSTAYADMLSDVWKFCLFERNAKTALMLDCGPLGSMLSWCF